MHRNEMSQAPCNLAWDDHTMYLVAHTGYAWACSPVFARVLLVLISLFHCSLQTVMYY